MKRFRKKPIEIEAVQFTDENKDRVLNWAKEIQSNISHSWQDDKPCLIVPTLEGEMICSLGDYLIKEPFPTDWRKIYPCKESIFNQTYESLATPQEEQGKGVNDVLKKRFGSDEFINNVCLSYNHSFGLMNEDERKSLVFECKEWMRAISNNWPYFKEPSPLPAPEVVWEEVKEFGFNSQQARSGDYMLEVFYDGTWELLYKGASVAKYDDEGSLKTAQAAVIAAMEKHKRENH